MEQILKAVEYLQRFFDVSLLFRYLSWSCVFQLFQDNKFAIPFRRNYEKLKIDSLGCRMFVFSHSNNMIFGLL